MAQAEELELIRRSAAVVGHELRNPLAAINNSAYFLKAKLGQGRSLDPKVEKHLNIVASEIERADRMIADIIAFARPLETKPAKLSTGELLWRTTPPSVSLPKKQDAVIQALIRADLGHLIRTKQEVNKEAILDDTDAVKGIAGIKIKRREEFVAKPFESQIERAEPVKAEVKAA